MPKFAGRPSGWVQPGQGDNPSKRSTYIGRIEGCPDRGGEDQAERLPVLTSLGLCPVLMLAMKLECGNAPFRKGESSARFLRLGIAASSDRAPNLERGRYWRVEFRTAIEVDMIPTQCT